MNTPLNDYDGKADVDVEAEIAKMTREPNGELSHYHPAQCALSEDKLSDMSRLVLGQLRDVGAIQFVVRYDGGGDEGFVHFGELKTPVALKSQSQIIEQLQAGPLGEKHGQSAYFYPPEREATFSRGDWTKDALELLSYELASELLGGSFGTGEFSLEGGFVADLQANTLTDIAPTERS